ncbi:hypothetical protein GIB67_039190 [Kingdonia uniflora]|uniref:RNA polymerase II subunit 5-mediating protein homolog n=1 Tax=Kingdonia uniflora TaxID=39325 RepID=A0A7J7MLS3_9MAGN|nr:hypothetical protein GIB67_039190 [Kingdonia uniflora]
MEEESMKGTVTSIASLYPVEEAQKAAKRVEESIIEKKKELDRINTFVTENTNLVNLVQRLPDELSHNIMVPFGKAAFFPGRLIHTNEFYVLLGEGYYAERTSKQTTEILQRRGKFLDSQVDSLKAMMLDLKAEASFFGDTATESAEGLVEIREDYIEEDFTGITPNRSGSPKSDMLSSSEESIKKIDAEDEEYACIMSRLDELEKEELGAESADESDEVCDTKADLECSTSLHKFDHNLKISEVQLPRHPLQHGPKGQPPL